MTGRALNYQLRGNTGPNATFLKISFQNNSDENSADCFLSVTTMKTIDLGFSNGKCLINKHGDISQIPDTPITNGEDGLTLKMHPVLHIHSRSLKT